MKVYYVYELIDPRDGKPFYVGKGKGKRVEQHTKEARSGQRSKKCAKIREILDAGFDVDRRIVRWFGSEDRAYTYEQRLIAEHGLNALTNIMPGGRGFPGWVRPTGPKKEAAELISLALSIKLSESVPFFEEFYDDVIKRRAKELIDENGRAWFADIANKVLKKRGCHEQVNA